MKRLLLLLTACVPQLVSSSPQYIVVKGQAPNQLVGASCAILTDSASSLNAEQAILSPRFEPCALAVPNLGTTSAAFWIKFDVLNSSKNALPVLTLPHPELDELDVYLMIEGKLEHLASTGQSRKEHHRQDDLGEYAFSLPIAEGGSGTVMLRVKSNKQLQIPMLLGTLARSAEARSKRNLAIGSYIGVMLVLALYNLFIFFSIRERSYVYYVGYIALVAMTQLTFFGFGQFYLWPNDTWFCSKASIIFTLATATAATEFMKLFLQTRTVVPRMHSAIKWFYLSFVACLIMYLFGDPLVGYKLAQAISGIYAFFFLAVAIAVWKKGSRQAGYFLIAWTLFLAGTIVFVLKDTGILPYNDLTVYTMPLGSAVEGILLSFGLADKINVLRRDKEHSQAAALHAAQENERITRDQNQILELKVTERTHQLQESLDHLKETQSQLVEAERMSSLGQLTAGIAHEINNPVNFIRSNIGPLKRDMLDLMSMVQAAREGRSPKDMAALDEQLGLNETIAEVHAILHSMEEGANRTAEIVQGLRTFSRVDEGDLKMADLNEGIRSTLNMLGPNFRDEVEVRFLRGDIPSVECYPGKLNQVFMNMINNAMQAARTRYGRLGGLVEVTTSFYNDQVRVTIRDNGTGMDASTKARIFEPFFTTKAVGEGTGLGLSIAHSIVEKHHGQIEVDSIEGQGTEFRIALPVRMTLMEAKRA